MIIPAHRIPRCCAVAVLALLCGCAAPQSRMPAGHPAMMAPGHGAAMHGTRDAADEAAPASTPALPLAQMQALSDILPELERMRVVYVGETHDQYAHHLAQLEIIRHLYEADPNLAIGVEFFQQPFQAPLDEFIAGSLDETGMLKATEYFRRWGYDYRLYAPIMRFAREHGLPVIALNAPLETVEQVRRLGIDGLSAADRATVPADIDRGDAAYEKRMRAVFDMHAHQAAHAPEFGHFLDVQLLWDESMAQRAADYLRDHPDRRMVVLAGSGHLAYGSGIPNRVGRRIDVRRAIVLNDLPGPISSGAGAGPDVGDYLLMPRGEELPPAGRMGMMLEDDGDGVKLVSCMKGSACESAALRAGDRLLALDGTEVPNVNAVQALMWNREPGEKVTATVLRERMLLRPSPRDFALELR